MDIPLNKRKSHLCGGTKRNSYKPNRQKILKKKNQKSIFIYTEFLFRCRFAQVTSFFSQQFIFIFLQNACMSYTNMHKTKKLAVIDILIYAFRQQHWHFN
jgi:hypothetical protein